jgi:hypothetical protein
MTNQEDIQKTLMDCELVSGMIVDKALNANIDIQTGRVVTGSRRHIHGRARLGTEFQDLLYSLWYSCRA